MRNFTRSTQVVSSVLITLSAFALLGGRFSSQTEVVSKATFDEVITSKVTLTSTPKNAELTAEKLGALEARLAALEQFGIVEAGIHPGDIGGTVDNFVKDFRRYGPDLTVFCFVEAPEHIDVAPMVFVRQTNDGLHRFTYRSRIDNTTLAQIGVRYNFHYMVVKKNDLKKAIK